LGKLLLALVGTVILNSVFRETNEGIVLFHDSESHANGRGVADFCMSVLSIPLSSMPT
jgi:hypothetical protein